MQRIDHNGLILYTFASLTREITHAITTRHGGISPAPFDTLNLSRAVGDDPNNVAQNLGRLHNALGLDATTTVDASQVHSHRVAIIDERQRGTRIPDVDALITNVPGIPLMLRFADCVPIVFYDPTHRAIGVSHAGWRGTVNKIAAQTAQTMFDTFGTRPRDLIACIAPSIGPCCYQVGGDVIDQVRAMFSNASELLIAQPNGAVHFDLWQANVSQLSALGIEQIEIANICTAHHTDDFYSWRAENNKTGRFGAIVAIRN